MTDAAGPWGDRPWQVEDCSENGCPCIVYQGEYKPFDEPQVPPIQYVADGETPDHAAHIASWHPGVALAVAGWLDVYAERFASWTGPHISAELGVALAVARAYLGSKENGHG